MEFPDTLTFLKKDRMVSTNKLAIELNVSPSTISLWESGKRKPDYNKIMELCRFFKVTSDFLLGLNTENTDSLFMTIIENDKVIKATSTYKEERYPMADDLLHEREQRETIYKQIDELKRHLNIINTLVNDELASSELKKSLNREERSISNKIRKLEASSSDSTNKIFSLAEDLDNIDNDQSQTYYLRYQISQILINKQYVSSIGFKVFFLDFIGIEIPGNIEDNVKQITDNFKLAYSFLLDNNNISKALDDIKLKLVSYNDEE